MNLPNSPRVKKKARGKRKSQPSEPAAPVEVRRSQGPETRAIAQLLRYRFANEFADAQPIPYVVKGWLESRTLAVLFGESGAGKSHVVIDMALHIAQGKAWFGHRVTRGAVLYVAAEGGGGLRNRIIAARMAGELPEDLPLAVITTGVTLDGESDVGRIIATCREISEKAGCDVSLVVFDTLARTMTGDENSSQDMSKAVRSCDSIRETTGAAVLLVHHSGKDAKRGARGSSALKAAVDSELCVEVKDKGRRQLTATKQRDMEPAKPVWFALESVQIGTDSDGDPITAAVVRDGEAGSAKVSGRQQVKLLAELERLQAESSEQLYWQEEGLRRIGRDLGMHKNSARSAVDGLRKSGALGSFTEGKGNLSKLLNLCLVNYQPRTNGTTGDEMAISAMDNAGAERNDAPVRASSSSLVPRGSKKAAR